MISVFFSLFFSLFSNYYIGFFVCIFVALVFFCYEICCWRGFGRFLLDLAAKFNAKFAEDTVTVTISDQYRNMEAGIAKVPFLIEAAKEALQSVGLEPHLCAIRGGTDGAHLTAMGIPCPNLGTGGRNYHGECEYAIVEEIEQSFRIVLELAKHRTSRLADNCSI